MSTPPEDGDAWEEEVRDVTPLRPLTQSEDTEQVAPKPKAKPASSPRMTRAYPDYDSPAREARLEKLDANTLRRIRIGALRISARLDLHDMSAQSAYEALLAFITHAYQSDMRLVLVITGKGSVSQKGILRQSLPRWCREPVFQPMVVGLHKAFPQHGGDGAYYVRIRRLL